MDDFWSKYHKDTLSSTGAWIEWSNRLKNVSQIVWKELSPSLIKLPKQEITIEDFRAIELMPVFMMLAGLSIELIAKARCIKKGNQKKLSSHRISYYVENKILTEQEKDLIKRLEVFIKWAGRYPIPLKEEDFVPIKVRLKGGAFPTFSMSDKKIIDDLYTKLHKLIKTEMT